MFGGLFIASLIVTCYQAVKEACAPTIPAENWANKKLIHQDRMKNISEKEFSKNLVNGKYKMTKVYPEPHRMEDGRIIIENCKLYNEDIKKYGAYQTHQWMRQGKYNLTSEELQKQHKEFERRMEYLYNL